MTTVPHDPYSAAEAAKEQADALLDNLLAATEQLQATIKHHNQLAAERRQASDAGKRPAYLSAARIIRASARARNLPPAIADAIANATFYAAPPDTQPVTTPPRARRTWAAIHKHDRIQEHRGQLLRNTTTPTTWLIRAYAGIHEGRRIYHNETIRGSQLEAERALSELLAAVHSRAARPIEAYTFAEYTRSVYLPEARKRLKANVYRMYENDLESRLIPSIGERLMRTLTKRTLTQLKRAFTDAGAAQSTAETTIATLRRVLRHASQHGMRAPALLPHETE